MQHPDIIGDYDFPEPIAIKGTPPWPTRTKPGTLCKIIVYRWRDSNGYHLDHPGDRSIRREHVGMTVTPSDLERMANVPDCDTDEECDE